MVGSFARPVAIHQGLSWGAGLPFVAVRRASARASRGHSPGSYSSGRRQGGGLRGCGGQASKTPKAAKAPNGTTRKPCSEYRAAPTSTSPTRPEPTGNQKQPPREPPEPKLQPFGPKTALSQNQAQKVFFPFFPRITGETPDRPALRPPRPAQAAQPRKGRAARARIRGEPGHVLQRRLGQAGSREEWRCGSDNDSRSRRPRTGARARTGVDGAVVLNLRRGGPTRCSRARTGS